MLAVAAGGIPRTGGPRPSRVYRVMLLTAATLAAPFIVPVLVLKRSWRVGLCERLGRVPATPRGRPAIWVHGASVGEIAAVAPLVQILRSEYPEFRVVISSLTVGGREAARTRVPWADARILFPLDLPFAVARAVRAIGPSLVLFTETELWPNFLVAVAARGIPAIMVSGRLSARAFARYRRWRWLFAPALATVRWFGVQSFATASRLVALGAPADRIVVTGSLKQAAPRPAGGLTLAGLGVAGEPVLVAGSTHAGEEELVLEAWRAATERQPAARLVLAPRRPERFAEAADLLARRGLRFVRRSELGSAEAARWPRDVPILLLDTLGELAGLYAGARIAFVGGTLVPVGGHNVLEPAAAGTPVVFGPQVGNAPEAAAHLVACGGGVQVAGGAELAARLGHFLCEPGAAEAAGRRALAAVADHGALAVTMAMVRGTLARGLRAGAQERR